MTRVNVGVPPVELCDQHLLAELRELPRCFAFDGAAPHAPAAFCLGTGHVLWCARHHLSLADRLGALRAEAQRRGFALSAWPPPAVRNAGRWGPADEARAAPLLRARIADRLATMARAPRWTAAAPPAWAG